MFSRYVKWADAIESDCLRILIYVLTLFTPVGLLVGLFESQFQFWIWLLIWSGIFSVLGIGIGLIICIIIKITPTSRKGDAEQESNTNQEDNPDKNNSTRSLPTEKRYCRKCGNINMTAVERDKFIIDSFDFECPNCGHKINLNKPGAIGVYTGLSLILFVLWLAFFLNSRFYTLHDYFSYFISLILIWYLPISMAIKLWLYPVTDIGTEITENNDKEKTSDPLRKATVMSNIWLSTASFLRSLLTFIGFITLFLGGAMLLGIIHDYSIESLWNGQFWEVLWEGIQLFVNMIKDLF